MFITSYDTIVYLTKQNSSVGGKMRKIQHQKRLMGAHAAQVFRWYDIYRIKASLY
jgi:hypothetical protein